MKLEIGEYYLSAGSEIVKIEYAGIVMTSISNNAFVLYDTSDNYYEENGKCIGDMREFDLIAHIPKQLHLHFLNEINSYYTDKDFKEIVDSVWGDK